MCFHKYGCPCGAGLWEIYVHNEHCKREAVKAAKEAAEEAVKAKKEATKRRVKAYNTSKVLHLKNCRDAKKLRVEKSRQLEQLEQLDMVDELDFENLRPSMAARKNRKKCDATELRFRRTAMGKSRNYVPSRSDLNCA